MRNLESLGLVALIAMTAGCEPSIDTAGTQGQTSNQKQQPSLVLEVTGPFEERFEGHATFFCGKAEFGQGQEFELYAAGDGQFFNLRFPQGLSLGEHALVGAQDSGLQVTQPQIKYELRRERKVFSRDGSGTFALSNLPTQRGEQLAAEIEASLSDRDGTTIQIKATIASPAGFQTFEECAGVEA